MPLTLDATAGGANANSYLTLEDAADVLAQRLGREAWFTTTANRPVALIHATSLLDTLVTWRGAKASTTQALQWPRLNVIDLQTGLVMDSTVIPQWLTIATAELAWHLVQDNPTLEAASLGLDSLRLGPLTLNFGSSAEQRVALFPPQVRLIIAPYLTSGAGFIAKKLVRT